MMKKLFDNVIFFNHYHNGDIHISRNYIKQMVNSLSPHIRGAFFETHRNDPYILSDLEGVNHYPYSEFSNLAIPYNVPYYLDPNRNLFINTWAGQDHPRKDPDRKKCTFPCIIENYNFILEDLGIGEICECQIKELFPSIEYDQFHIHNIDSFVSSNDSPNVMVCNGETLSGQCENFNFNPIVEQLADEFTSINFIMTNVKDEKIAKNNVLYSEDIILKDGCDLNETAYLSEFCGVVVGRISGPHTFSFTKGNYLNRKKINISICNDETEADYDAKTYRECRMRTMWSQYESLEQVKDMMRSAIIERFKV